MSVFENSVYGLDNWKMPQAKWAMKGLVCATGLFRTSLLRPLGIAKVPVTFFNLICPSWTHVLNTCFPAHSAVLWGCRAIEKWGLTDGGRSPGVAFESDA